MDMDYENFYKKQCAMYRKHLQRNVKFWSNEITLLKRHPEEYGSQDFKKKLSYSNSALENAEKRLKALPEIYDRSLREICDILERAKLADDLMDVDLYGDLMTAYDEPDYFEELYRKAMER